MNPNQESMRKHIENHDSARIMDFDKSRVDFR